MFSPYRGVVLVSVSAVAFGVGPFFARAAYTGGANVPTLMLFRFGIAAGLLWGYLLWRHRAEVRLPAGTIVRLMLLGSLGYAVMSTLYFSSVRFVSPALAALLLYTYPVMVATEGAILFREHLAVRTVAALVLALGGLALALGTGLGQLHRAGVMQALGAAVVYSLYITLSSRVVAGIPPLVVTVWISTATTAGFALAVTVTGWSLVHTADGWGGVLGISFVTTLLAITTFFAGMQLVGPARAAILSTLEPLVTIVAAWLILGEGLSTWQWLGATLVIGSAVLVATERSVQAAPLAQAALPPKG